MKLLHYRVFITLLKIQFKYVLLFLRCLEAYCVSCFFYIRLHNIITVDQNPCKLYFIFGILCFICPYSHTIHLKLLENFNNNLSYVCFSYACITVSSRYISTSLPIMSTSILFITFCII